jgi:hypothetical protein
MEWIKRSVRKQGGSAATLAVTGTWSRSYPETTGYIIETLLQYERITAERGWRELAHRLADWLLDIQLDCGAWGGGLHPSRDVSPSVFNTGQILLGLAALYDVSSEQQYLDSLVRGAAWLTRTEAGKGTWQSGNYKGDFNPTYYTRVTWPMLEAWRLSGDDSVRSAAERVLEVMRNRRLENGSFSGWGFSTDGAAFTHTIAYTLRGFIESGRLLGDADRYLELVTPAIDRLFRRGELRQGRLPGSFDSRWKGDDRFVCLTGNAQVGLVFLRYEAFRPDLRLVNAASRLIDYVCDRQASPKLPPRFRGAIAGSDPIWGPYLRLRYPNWAAKFFADSIMLLLARLKAEQEALSK